MIGQLPTRPIEKGIAGLPRFTGGAGLLAHLLISKYVDHLPLYRQRKQFKRQGVDLSDSTLCGRIKAGYELLLPLYEVQRSKLFSSSYLMADETPIRVLDGRKVGRSHTGYYWVYYNPLKRQIYFDYRDNRSRDRPGEMLQGFQGYLQSDGYSAYDEITSRGKAIIPVGCFAHACRYFDQAKENDRRHAEWIPPLRDSAII